MGEVLTVALGTSKYNNGCEVAAFMALVKLEDGKLTTRDLEGAELAGWAALSMEAKP